MEDLLPGQDGVVQAARVRVACSEGKPNVLRRSIEQLIPLEVTERLEETEGGPDEGEDKEPDKTQRDLMKMKTNHRVEKQRELAKQEDRN